MKQRRVVAIAVAQDYLVSTKYALKVMGVYSDGDCVLRWYTYDILARGTDFVKITSEAYKIANKMDVPFLASVHSTRPVSDEHIRTLRRRGLIDQA